MRQLGQSHLTVDANDAHRRNQRLNRGIAKEQGYVVTNFCLFDWALFSSTLYSAVEFDSMEMLAYHDIPRWGCHRARSRQHGSGSDR